MSSSSRRPPFPSSHECFVILSHRTPNSSIYESGKVLGTGLFLLAPSFYDSFIQKRLVAPYVYQPSCYSPGYSEHWLDILLMSSPCEGTKARVYCTNGSRGFVGEEGRGLGEKGVLGILLIGGQSWY